MRSWMVGPPKPPERSPGEEGGPADAARVGSVRSAPVESILLFSLWAVVVVTGMAMLARYALGPGRAGHPPAVWPATSHVARSAESPTLVMIAHPRCACTRASLGELAILMAHCRGNVSATVLFVRPPGTSPAWNETDLRRTAESIPGVRVLTDEGGIESRRFGAVTSGQVVLYDAAGRLRFSGGITAGRGHSGDNAGREALQELLLAGATQRATTPVFGCGLFDPGTGTRGPVP